MYLYAYTPIVCTFTDESANERILLPRDMPKYFAMYRELHRPTRRITRVGGAMLLLTNERTDGRTPSTYRDNSKPVQPVISFNGMIYKRPCFLRYDNRLNFYT